MVKLFFRDGLIRLSVGLDIRVNACNFKDGSIQKGESNFGIKSRKIKAILESAEKEIEGLYVEGEATKDDVRQVLERIVAPYKWKSSAYN